MFLSYLLSERASDLSNPLTEGLFPEPVSPNYQCQGFLISSSQASAGTPCLEETRGPVWVGTAVTLLQGAACKLIFLVGRDSQDGAGRFYLDPGKWRKLSLMMVRSGGSERVKEPV